MKTLYLFSILLTVISCGDRKNTSPNTKMDTVATNLTIKPELQSIIDKFEVSGSVLIYDLNKDTYYSNDYVWANRGFLPASTFKIPNSIIALETGVVQNDSVLFKWDGQEKMLKQWEQDMLFRDAFHLSCVPCYQDVARRIGESRMNNYLKKLDYGDMHVDEVNIDNFWLEGKSRISQMEQIDFLKRFYNAQLPLSEKTYNTMKRMMIAYVTDQYVLRHKTGLSNVNENYNGWYVGYFEMDDNVYFFATNIQPGESFRFETFIAKRQAITFEAMKHLKLIK